MTYTLYRFKNLLNGLSVLLIFVVFCSNDAQAQDHVISYDGSPQLTDVFFQAINLSDTVSRFRPQLQSVQAPSETSLSGSVGLLAWQARAITFPKSNSLLQGPDREAARAYFQAMWHISGYHAALLKSRLRREATKHNSLLPTSGLAIQAVQSGVEAEWTLALEALATETGYGADPLRVIAFTEQYAAAVDTVTWPLIENRPHGMELHFGFGAAMPIGFAERLKTGFGMDLGIGYTYDRWIALLMVGVNRTPVTQPADASKPILNDATQWNNVGIDLGYRWYRTPQWESTVRLRLGEAELNTGGGDEQTDLRRDFMTGFAATVSRSIGKTIVGERATGRRSGFALQALVSYTPQRWLDDLKGGAVYIGLGAQMTFYGSGYTRE